MNTSSFCLKALVLTSLSFSPMAAIAQFSPEWISTIPVGSSFETGIQDMVTDGSGNSYVTGVTGTGQNLDTITAAFGPDGSLLWSHIFNGNENWHDTAFALSLAPGGVLYVVGNTPGPLRYADVLVLKYDAATGALLNTIQYSSKVFTSESGRKVVTDSLGNVYVGGTTVGDAADAMIVKFNAAGLVQWTQKWDGPALGPFSNDSVRAITIDASGNPVLLINGIGNSNRPDYVVLKYAASDGAVLWETSWGTIGSDFPEALAFDTAGDLYVMGTSITNGLDRFGTIKLNGSNGQLIWESHNGVAFNNIGVALALDDSGGVYVTGRTDPDSDRSNGNDDFFTAKLDAATGAELWTHTFGARCGGCLDEPADIKVDSAGNVLLVGRSSSPPFSRDMLLFVLDSGTGLSRDLAVVGQQPTGRPIGRMLRLDAAENIFIGGDHANFTTGVKGIAVTRFASLAGGCYADCDQTTGVGVLDVFDFLCFQNSFVAGEPFACDCDTSTGGGVCDIFDFLCFQDAFVAGCP